MLAAECGHSSLVGALLRFPQTPRGLAMAMRLAVQFDRRATVEVLLTKCAVDIRCPCGGESHGGVEDLRTPLHLACQGGLTAVAEVLLKHGARVEERTVSPMLATPPFLAAYFGDAAALLLRYGASADTADGQHLTAMTAAQANGFPVTAAFLRERGAKKDAPVDAPWGVTPTERTGDRAADFKSYMQRQVKVDDRATSTMQRKLSAESRLESMRDMALCSDSGGVAFIDLSSTPSASDAAR